MHVAGRPRWTGRRSATLLWRLQLPQTETDLDYPAPTEPRTVPETDLDYPAPTEPRTVPELDRRTSWWEAAVWAPPDPWVRREQQHLASIRAEPERPTSALVCLLGRLVPRSPPQQPRHQRARRRRRPPAPATAVRAPSSAAASAAGGPASCVRRCASRAGCSALCSTLQPRAKKKSPSCLRRCMMQGLLHPAQCHSLC
ncbi:uncharacterized protein LOC122384430 isoform X3 [Amphibalanus amphitrite]|nr:uncharacterized protein LOC122384430 isoform X3 [Amphibalanus amphitrite]